MQTPGRRSASIGPVRAVLPSKGEVARNIPGECGRLTGLTSDSLPLGLSPSKRHHRRNKDATLFGRANDLAPAKRLADTNKHGEEGAKFKLMAGRCFFRARGPAQGRQTLLHLRLPLYCSSPSFDGQAAKTHASYRRHTVPTPILPKARKHWCAIAPKKPWNDQRSCLFGESARLRTSAERDPVEHIITGIPSRLSEPLTGCATDAATMPRSPPPPITSRTHMLTCKHARLQAASRWERRPFAGAAGQ